MAFAKTMAMHASFFLVGFQGFVIDSRGFFRSGAQGYTGKVKYKARSYGHWAGSRVRTRDMNSSRTAEEWKGLVQKLSSFQN